ncbi:MAG: ribose-phosphate diphosphokinase [Spirochaetaceae bacterium]|jgi:ribose-phosphate pyrophosphokinase|nr:ribose-phosphate diphosphokinase [Spirochaetaceae bacterium]
MEKDFVIMATRSMRSYASRVLEHILKYKSFADYGESINGVSALHTDRFADGEMEVVLNKSIRGKVAVLFSAASRNEAGINVEEAKIEQYHTIDVLARSQAKKIIVFEPYVSCSRSDRTTRRSSVGLWVHFKTLASLGVNHIVTYQLHSDKSKSILDPTLCVLDDIDAFNLLSKYICDKYIKTKAVLDDVVRKEWAFCSVDSGGEKIARFFANSFGTQLVVAHKQRDYSKANTIESINILSAVPIEGKKLWIVDDMIDTAGSAESLVYALAQYHPAEINLMAVHAPFSAPAEQRLMKLHEKGLLNHLIVSDTVHGLPSMPLAMPNLEIVSSAQLSANIIWNIITNHSMTDIRQSFNTADYLSKPGLF